MIYRHGDVLIRSVASLPENASEHRAKRVILAHGEVTGHTHSFGPGARVRLFRDDGLGRSFLKVEEPSALQHEEHAPITLPPGLYEVVIQSEYTPQRVRQVRD